MTTPQFFQRTALIAALALSTTAQAVTVVEYYNKAIDAYFLTGRATEQAIVDAAVDFQRTGMSFQAETVANATATMTPICRFYISGTTPFLSSHFYGRKGAECEDLRAKNIAGFAWEDFDFAVQESSSGVCAAGATTIYRSFRAGIGGKTSNHRYTASSATYNAAAAAGYVGEGPVFCVSAATPAMATTGGATFSSAVGATTGAAVSQSITSAGGKITAGGITVRAPKNQFGSSANVTVQPIADTLNGSGDAIQITSSAPWANALVVSFPFNATDGNPENLNLAMQADDGSWTVLNSVVNLVTNTVTALIPPNSPLSASGVASDHAKASASTGIRVGKLRNLIFRPGSATVKPGASVAFSAFARVDIENYDPQQKSPACAGYREAVRVAEASAAAGGDPLYPLPSSACNAPVVRDLPFTNDKAGFTREWTVDGPGSIAPGGIGATYTAPGTKPTPNVARVTFTSTNLATTASVIMWAPVTISDVVKMYQGTFNRTFSGDATGSFNSSVTWTLKDSGGGKLQYEATGTGVLQLNNSACSASGTGPLASGNLDINTSPRTEAGVSLYTYVAEIRSAAITLNCANGAISSFGSNATCTGSESADLKRLKGTCAEPQFSSTTEWDFVAID